jgi:two-component system sensor histidine kinase QseC
MIKKYRTILYLNVGLLLGWTLSIYELVEDHADTLLWTSVILQIIFVTSLYFITKDLIPIGKLREIFRLATEIEKRVEKSNEIIDVNSVPQEIKPLVNAVNRLIEYQEDRYNNERDFTANASHELRTPLAGIRIQAEVALSTDDAEKKSNALKNILKSVDRATRLVEQLLVLSRLTSEKIDLAKEAVNLSEIAKRTASEISHFANNKNIIINQNIEDNVFIDASEQSIEILLDNLLRNAVIYNTQNSSLEVGVFKDQNYAFLYVSDKGVGVSLDKREVIFKRFEKGDRTSKTGTGLGLAIVKRIADLHNAKVEVLDNADYKGIKFLVTFNLLENENN